ncbi:porin [Vibrio nomapromontoriensis]|uniref:porin n=1 Tax=Vibrio nomapromontoriensis TaxID=2910246 RepID=UPI003D1256D5
MRKTKLLLIAAPMLIPFHSAAFEAYNSSEGSVSIYGHLRTNFTKESGKELSLDAGSSRLGVDANYNITDTLYAIGLVEIGLKDNNQALYTRLHYTGLGGDWGQLTWGRQYTPQDDISSGVDYSWDIAGIGTRYAPIVDDTHNSAFKYVVETETFFINSMVGLEKVGKMPGLYQAHAGFNVGPLETYFGVGREDFQGAAETQTRDLVSDYYSASAAYNIGDLTIGANAHYATYLSGIKKSIEYTYTAASKYQINETSSVFGGYEYVQNDQYTDENSEFNFVYIGADTRLTPNTVLYLEAGIKDGNLLSYSNKLSSNMINDTIYNNDKITRLGFRVYW